MTIGRFRRILFRVPLLLGAGISPFVLPAPAMAQASQGDQVLPADPYAALVAVINGVRDPDAQFAAVLAELRTAMVQTDPQISELEQQFPGLLDEMITAMTPYLRRHSERVTAQLQDEMTILLAERLTQDEAAGAARFYSSARGQRLLAIAQRNLTLQETIAEAVESRGEADITAQAVEADIASTVSATLQDMSPAELAAINDELAGTTWSHKLRRLIPEIAQLRADMENAPMLPTEQAGMERAIEAAVVAFISGKEPVARPSTRK